MVGIVFLVDTSASMNQKTAQGMSYLDLAKNGILTFMKFRGRDPASRADRYSLVTLDDPTSSIKVGLLHWHSFANELKNLHAKGVSTLSQGLKEALELLNVQRLQSGIDQFGQGRNPFYLDPAVIISITDGGKYMKLGGLNNYEIEDEVLFPLCNSYAGSDLTKEMFRWDQRLFTILLRVPGIMSSDSTIVEDTSDPIFEHFSSLCDYSGGKCYSATSVKSLYQTMESISQKMFPGVVLNFRKIGSEPIENSFYGWKTRPKSIAVSKENTPVPTRPSGGMGGSGQQTEDNNVREISPQDKSLSGWNNLRKMIYVRTKSGGGSAGGHWPIPESFWPEMSNGTIPPRDVHPVVWVDDKDVPPMLLENFAFDKYELEPSPLTQQLLGKRNPNVCWEVFISDSGRERGLTYPFGYLKSSSSGNFVNLFVMPFNYRRLIPLIEDLQKQRLKPSSKWRAEFADYVSTLPSYYAQPLRKSLQLMGAHPGLVPESFDGSLSYSITNYLRKSMDGHLGSNYTRKFKKQSEFHDELNSTKKSSKATEINGISVAIGTTEVESLSSQSYRNPFDISRLSLVEQVSRMRTNFLHSSLNTPRLIEEVDKHQVPIGQMGNYQQHLKKQDSLRELDTGAVRTQLFGNPFKLEKPSDKINMADEIMVEQHMKRPGSPTREPHRSKRRHSRSPTPTPHPPPPAPTPTPPSSSSSSSVSVDPRKNLPHDAQSPSAMPQTHKEEKMAVFNHHRNALPPSNDTLIGNSNNQRQGNLGRDVKALTSEKEPSVSSEKSATLSNNTSYDRNHHRTVSPTIAEKQQKERGPSSMPSRKRSPSPSLSNAPHSKRSNRDIVRTESLIKLSGNEKSPSPSPLLAPVRQTGLSSASQVLNEEFKRKQTTQNLKLKQTIVREIRKNSKSYEAIFQSLENVQGSVEAKKLFVRDIIKEAERFRKKHLIQYLEDWMSKLSSSGAGKAEGSNRSVKNSNKHNTSATAGQR